MKRDHSGPCPWQDYAASVKKLNQRHVLLQPADPHAVADKSAHAVPRILAGYGGLPSSGVKKPSVFCGEEADMFESWFQASHEVAPPSPCFKAFFTEKKLKRLRSGAALPEAKADFHGYDVRKMQRALRRSLPLWRAEGVRLASLITGKGSGKLREELPLMLADPENAVHVLAYESTGEGSFLVYLRKPIP